MAKDNSIFPRHLIADLKIIEQLRGSFTFIDKDNIYWTESYIDEETGNKWLYYRVDTYLQGGGYPIFALQPFPDTKRLIQLSLLSENDDEVFAACRTLVDNELTKKIDFRSDLIHELEHIDDNQRRQRIVELTTLDSASNRREILGKTLEEINLDANYYRSIAARAAKLKGQ